MIEEEQEKYINYFRKLNRGYNKGLGSAPHKPVLLLSMIQLIQNGTITSNRIFISSEIILAFKQNWRQLVDTNHTSNFSLPFFHLRSEPFWHLITKPGMKITTTGSKSIKSFKSLKESIAFAEIDRKLFLLLQEPIKRIVLEQVLLVTYFPNTKGNYLSPTMNLEENNIEREILNEPKDIYQGKIKKLREILSEDQYQEEIFIRGGLFKKTILKIFNHTCCISGMKIEFNSNVQMIDACHIHPFSISYDDTITNGLALSPNLHRAFDKGLLTINSNYIVRISPTVKDNNSTYSISQFEGQQINLPEKEKWFPSTASLEWHSEEVFLL